MVHVLLILLSAGHSGLNYNDLAKNRDVKALEASSAPSLKGRFDFLRERGAYGVGEKGWTAEELSCFSPDENLIVFTTPLTSQDRGDQVFIQRGGKLTSYINEKDTLGVRITHADMSLSFEPSKKIAHISSKTRFKRIGETGTYFLVRMSPQYKVSTVKDQEGKPVTFFQTGGVVSMKTPSASEFVYTLNYQGTVDLPQYAGAITEQEVMLTNDYWWPMIARLPITFTTESTVPANWTVVAQGEPVSSVTKGDKKIVKYDMKLPVSYLSYSAGPFETSSKIVNGRKYLVWSKEMSEAERNMQLELMPPVVQFFERFHEYPFSQFGAMVTSLYGGGALEAYSFATYGTGWLPDEDAHEPSHTWFGGIVPNTYLDSFWNESFASFSEGMFQREVSIGKVEDRRLAFVDTPGPNRQWNSHPIKGTGAEAGGVASSLGYGKGGYVLQQLEAEMGTKEFTGLVKKWLATHPTGEKAEWSGLRQTAGADWDWFFTQWLERTGWPSIQIFTAMFEKGQLQGNVTFAKEAYRAKVDVLLQFPNGISKIVQAEMIPTSARAATFRIATSDKPTSMTLDPWGRLFAGQGRPEYRRATRQMEEWVAPDCQQWASGREKLAQLPSDLGGVIVVANPETNAVAKKLCQQAGIQVKGGIAVYRGQSVSLSKGTVMALVEIKPGSYAAIRMGSSRRAPNVGSAYGAICDDLGRFLAGETKPRLNDALTAKVQ